MSSAKPDVALMGYGDIFTVLPLADIRHALESPSVTNKVPVQGYNVSEAWPGSEMPASDDEGWTMSLKFATDMLTGSAASSLVPENSVADIYAVYLNPPPSLLTTMDNGTTTFTGSNDTLSQYRLSYTVFNELLDSAYANGKHDDGSCTSVFSEQCLADLKADIQAGDMQSTPDSCHAELGWISFSTETSIHTSDIANYALFAQTSDEHEEGQAYSYSDPPVYPDENRANFIGGLRGRIVPVFVRWEASGNATAGSTAMGGGPMVACLNVETADTMVHVNYGLGDDDGEYVEEEGDGANGDGGNDAGGRARPLGAEGGGWMGAAVTILAVTGLATALVS